MPRYLLVSSDQALESCAQLFKGNWPDDLVFVASTSLGMVACERAGIIYATLDQFSSRDEIISLGWSNYSELTFFCERWDAAAQDFAPSLKVRGIKPFRFSYYDLKILVDSMSIKLLMLKNFIHNAAGQEIFYLPEPDHQIVAGEFLRPRGDVNMFSVLLEMILSGGARLSPLPCASIPERIDLRSILQSWRTSVRRRLKTLRGIIRTLQLFRSNRSSGYLCFNFGHDIAYVVPHLLRRQLKLIHPPIVAGSMNATIVEECDALWHRLSADEEFRGFFSHGATSYFPLIKEPLAEFIRSVLPRAISDHDHLREILPKLDIRFSLTGSINLGLRNRCRMLAAQASGAPLITYQEGAGYGSIITPIYDSTEALDGDAMLCYGTGNSEYYEDFGAVGKPFIPVGSAHQDAVLKGACAQLPPGQIRTVMYVGTIVEDNVMHCPNNGLVSTIFRSTQINIFRLLASLPTDVQIIAKPNPNDHISRELLQLPEFIRIRLENRRLEKVMQGVDLFILDFPSTVLLSCIATTAYVFVLAEQGVTGFTAKQKERLEKRAYLFDDFDSLASGVREIVTNITNFQPLLDENYLMAYSLHRPDGNAAERAAEALAGFATGEASREIVRLLS